MNKTPAFLATRLERFIRKLQEKATGDLNTSVYEECSSQGKKKLGLIRNFKPIKFQRIFKVQRLKFPLPGNNAQNKQMI